MSIASCSKSAGGLTAIGHRPAGVAYACLAPDVIHLGGSRRSVIYDLGRGRIYWMDEAARLRLETLLSGVTLADLAWDREMDQVYSFLTERGLICLEAEPRGEQLTAAKPRPRRPAMAWIELGTLCNHRCIHCYNESGPDPAPAAEPDPDLLLRAVDQLADAGTETLKIIGGEPLVHFDLVEGLLTRARNRGIAHYGVHTNGTLLTRTRARALAAIGASADVTVYGHCAGLHEAVTKTRFSFERTLGGLRNAVEARLATTVSLIVVPSNEHAIDEIASWFGCNFPDVAFGYDYTRPVGRATDLYRQMSLERLNRYREHFHGFPGITLEDYHIRTNSNPCLHDKVMITAEGTVSPCIMQRNSCGSLGDSSLAEILAGPAYSAVAGLSLNQVEVCRDCEFRLACTDCRPIAEGLSGSRTAKPPECPYDPYSGEISLAEREDG